MIALIFAALLSSVAFADCPINHYPRQAFTGSITAQINNDPKLHGTPQQYSFSLWQSLQQNGVSVVIGVTGLQLTTNDELDFIVDHLPSTILTALKFRLQVNDINLGWRSLKFNFFAFQSSLYLSAPQTINSFSGDKKDGRYSVYRPILNFNEYQTEPVIRLFLHGIQLKAGPIDQNYTLMETQYQKFRTFAANPQLIRYFAQALQQKKAFGFRIYGLKLLGSFFSFFVETSSTVNNMRFSYLLFSKRSFSPKHSHVLGDFYLLNNNPYKFTGLRNMNMVAAGLLGLKVPRGQRYSFDLAFQSYLEQSYFDTQTNYNYFTVDVTFIAFEMQQKFICDDCPNSPVIYEDKFCVQTCPRGFSRVARLDNLYCQRCDLEKLKIVDSSSGQCVCAKRHFLDSSQDICKPCRYDCMTCSQEDRCLTCDNNLLQTKRRLTPTGRCQCPTQRFYDDKASEDIVCQKCDSKCLTCNGPRAHDCLSCVDDKQLDPLGFCRCKNGFLQDSAGNCACNPPRILLGSFCLQTETNCTENQVVQFVQVSTRCICAPEAFPVGDKCIKCGINSFFSKEELRCKCTNKTVYINEQCVPCGYNQIFDDTTEICVCRPGTYKSANGTCVGCPLKMTYINEQCECIFNYFQSRPGVCERCLRETDGPKCRKNTF